MLHLDFINFGVKLASASMDGNLTVDEVRDCVEGLFDDTDSVVAAVEEASDEGSISVMDVLDIASTVVSKAVSVVTGD